MNKFYTAQEVADKLKIKKTTVYELIKRGELSSSKIGKQLRVSEDQLSLYLNGAAKNSVSAQHHDYQPESSLLKRDYLLHSSGLIISGQASPALDLLLNQLPSTPGNLPVLQSHMNTYNGLYSLYFEKVLPVPQQLLRMSAVWYPDFLLQPFSSASIPWAFM